MEDEGKLSRMELHAETDCLLLDVIDAMLQRTPSPLLCVMYPWLTFAPETGG